MAVKEKSKNGLTTNFEIENDVFNKDSKSIKNCFINSNFINCYTVFHMREKR